MRNKISTEIHYNPMYVMTLERLAV